MIDMNKLRREFIRWMLLITTNNNRAFGGTSESLLRQVVQSEYADASAIEVRAELDYLEARDLVKVSRHPGGHWSADITRWGIDIVEYAVDCDPGIARPKLTGL